MSTERVGKKEIQIRLDIIDVQIIQAKTPVVTGNLRDKFEVDPDGNIINFVDYVEKIEFGTTQFPGAFMVERSVEEIGQRLAKKVAEQINRPGLIVFPDIIIKGKF